MTIRIRHGLTHDQVPAAARLYWMAFGSKLGRVMGPERRALRFIEQVIEPGHVFVALDSAERVVGVIGFRTSYGSFVGGGRADLRAAYGRGGALWRGVCLHLLARDLAPEALMVDGLAVSPEMRGRGVGAALVGALSEFARERGYRRLDLDVIAENQRARALYLRLGFVPAGWRRSRLTRLAFDFHAVQTMQLVL